MLVRQNVTSSDCLCQVFCSSDLLKSTGFLSSSQDVPCGTTLVNIGWQTAHLGCSLFIFLTAVNIEAIMSQLEMKESPPRNTEYSYSKNQILYIMKIRLRKFG